MSTQLAASRSSCENKPGANPLRSRPIIVAKAPPDGYTVCFCTLGALVILPMIEKLTYKPEKELIPVTHVANQPFVVVVQKLARRRIR